MNTLDTFFAKILGINAPNAQSAKLAAHRMNKTVTQNWKAGSTDFVQSHRSG